MKMAKKVFSAILLFVMVFSSAPTVLAAELGEEDNEMIYDVYEYPVIPGTIAWIELGSTEARRAACEISEDILDRMTTRALALAAFDNPFSSELFAFDDLTGGLAHMIAESRTWAVLFNRSDLYETLYMLVDEPDTSDEALVFIAIILREMEPSSVSEEIVGSVFAAEKVQIRDAHEFHDDVARTPNGNWVRVYKNMYEWVYSKKLELNQRYQDLYPDATFISTSTMAYNCFSYAFYYQSASNEYVMSSPSLYISDGSYARVASPRVGDIAVYKAGSAYDHAGVVSWVNGSNIWVCSKWGSSPLMDHEVFDCPYSGDTVTYYRVQR